MSGLRDEARRNGIETEYTSEAGTLETVSDGTLRALLEALRHDGRAKEAPPREAGAGMARCYLPSWFARERCWGFTCQLYGLRSGRNWGIGDFDDLAVFAEAAAALGADFLGINPLHALFPQAPDRNSPYSPSSRRFLNALYIAPDRLPEFAQLEDGNEAAEAATLRETTLLDYPAIARLKARVLNRAFANAPQHPERWRAFGSFREDEGEGLESFALHEAIAEFLIRTHGRSLTWPAWPPELQDPENMAVRRFAEANAERIAFHAWLQWVAARQLAKAQERACRAGMRIGLYADLAVGVAADGAATWRDRRVVVADAHIGAPPDPINAQGQDWGLAPFSPQGLSRADMAPLRDDMRAAMTSAGALRIDHAMILSRLYLIPAGAGAHEGAYVRYPFDKMMATVAEQSQRRRCLVVGETLGTVEPDFRKRLARAQVLSYQVLFFERRADGRFRKPRSWSRLALACLSTHDLATLAGWWSGQDIDWRERSGFASAGAAGDQRDDRRRDKALLTEALRDAGLWSGEVAEETTPELCAAVHRYVARTPARALAVQIEDALGLQEQANLPGPSVQHPNWRRRLPIPVERLGDDPHLLRTVEAVNSERRRPDAT
ncbi:MAG: 4-alpha-glucanotransferase [Acetobacterales bacterium]